MILIFNFFADPLFEIIRDSKFKSRNNAPGGRKFSLRTGFHCPWPYHANTSLYTYRFVPGVVHDGRRLSFVRGRRMECKRNKKQKMQNDGNERTARGHTPIVNVSNWNDCKRRAARPRVCSNNRLTAIGRADWAINRRRRRRRRRLVQTNYRRVWCLRATNGHVGPPSVMKMCLWKSIGISGKTRLFRGVRAGPGQQR